MTKDNNTEIKSILKQLSESYRKKLRSKLRNYSFLSNDPFDQSNEQAKDDLFDLLETNSVELISEAARQCLAVSSSPDTFAELDKAVSSYLKKIDGDLALKLSLIQRTATRSMLEGPHASEFRRKIERLLDSYRPSLVVAFDTAKNSSGSTRGRKPKYDWLAATNTVWGQIFRKELVPTTQAQIELALGDAATGGKGFEMGDTTARPFARTIWQAMGNEPEDCN